MKTLNRQERKEKPQKFARKSQLLSALCGLSWRP
jgi:hypothetical protein